MKITDKKILILRNWVFLQINLNNLTKFPFYFKVPRRWRNGAPKKSWLPSLDVKKCLEVRRFGYKKKITHGVLSILLLKGKW